MKSIAITSGNFATSEGNKGNFTAKTARGEQIFIHKTMLEALGIKTNDDFQKAKPLYAIIDTITITPRDAEGNDLEPVDRTQAISIFKSEDELIEAELADDQLAINTAIRRKQMIEKSTKDSGLTEESINSILSASSLFKQ